MTCAHTPGPWIVGPAERAGEKPQKGYAWISAPEQKWWGLAEVVVSGPWGNKKSGVANANLIAAAPDLLAALEVLLAREEENRRDFIDGHTVPIGRDPEAERDMATLDDDERQWVAEYDEVIGQARSAIAKAKGVQP